MKIKLHYQLRYRCAAEFVNPSNLRLVISTILLKILLAEFCKIVLSNMFVIDLIIFSFLVSSSIVENLMFRFIMWYFNIFNRRPIAFCCAINSWRGAYIMHPLKEERKPKTRNEIFLTFITSLSKPFFYSIMWCFSIFDGRFIVFGRKINPRKGCHILRDALYKKK